MTQDELIFAAITISIPALWLATHLLLLKSRYYKHFLIANTLVLVTGLLILNLFRKKIFGDDPYFLAILLSCAAFVICQTVFAFALAVVFYFLKIRGTNTTTGS